MTPRRRRWILGLFALVGISELGSRAYWWMVASIPPLHPDRFVQVFYPQLKRFFLPHPTGASDFDVLVLGASVLHEEFGTFELEFNRALEQHTDRPFHVFNLSTPSHTSRDSLNKYFFARDRVDFDLVIVYHGINELRTNNCPPDMFRDDYSHYTFNRITNTFFENRWLTAASFPATAYYGYCRLSERLGWADVVPRGRPRSDWLQFGSTIRSAACLHDNLLTIARDARSRNVPVLLMSFAYSIPDNYSKAAFDAHRLDYGAHRLPIELWGSVENVRKGLELHNRRIQQVAEESGSLFIDQNARLEKSGRIFDDICHLTPAGCQAFVRNLMEAVDPLLSP